MASFPATLIASITGAIHDASKLPAALVSCGIFLIASALGLIVSKSPGAVLITWHGSAAAWAKVLLSISLVPLAVVLALWAGLRV
jgi:hypothetical protein